LAGEPYSPPLSIPSLLYVGRNKNRENPEEASAKEEYGASDE